MDWCETLRVNVKLYFIPTTGIQAKKLLLSRSLFYSSAGFQKQMRQIAHCVVQKKIR